MVLIHPGLSLMEGKETGGVSTTRCSEIRQTPDNKSLFLLQTLLFESVLKSACLKKNASKKAIWNYLIAVMDFLLKLLITTTRLLLICMSANLLITPILQRKTGEKQSPAVKTLQPAVNMFLHSVLFAREAQG